MPPRALLPHESKLLALFGRDSVWCIYDESLAYSFISEGGMQKLLDARAVESAEELRKIVYGSTNAQLQQRLASAGASRPTSSGSRAGCAARLRWASRRITTTCSGPKST